MSNQIELVKQYNKAMATRDEKLLRQVVADGYSFKGPIMSLDGVEQLVMMMMNFPFEHKNENVEFFTNNNKVMQSFEWTITSPFQFKLPTCEQLEIENNKIKSSRLYCDTAKFPDELMKTMNI